jgi:hypothetical protein
MYPLDMGGDFKPKSEWLRDNRVGVFDQMVSGEEPIVKKLKC